MEVNFLSMPKLNTNKNICSNSVEAYRFNRQLNPYSNRLLVFFSLSSHFDSLNSKEKRIVCDVTQFKLTERKKNIEWKKQAKPNMVNDFGGAS